jgi:hypothetical protein
MNKYLLMTDGGELFEDFYIIEASSLDKVYHIAAKKLFKSDEFFIEYLRECAINMSFAEKFWLKTDEESDYFCKHHKTLIDFNEFKRRVKEHFGLNNGAAHDYLTFYTLTCDGFEKEANVAFENFIKNAEDLLIEEYLEFTELKAISISEIKKL